MKTKAALKQAKQAASHIKLVVLDVDGVLTDGSIIIGNDGELYKRFNVKDGLGIKLLQDAGISVAICTGRTSEIVEVRAEELGISLVMQGERNKKEALAKICIELGLTAKDVAYMGDDLPDVGLFEVVALSAAPSDASPIAKKKALWISQCKGGQGAVREFAEFILKEKGQLKNIIRSRFGDDTL